MSVCVFVRDALNKMKDVYEKNPQMGDPSSLQPKISETICNMEKLRSEIHKNEVKKRDGNVKKNTQLVILAEVSSLSLSVNRLGYLRWRESRAPEETEDTALTTTITLLKAERGENIYKPCYPQISNRYTDTQKERENIKHLRVSTKYMRPISLVHQFFLLVLLK